MRNLRWGNTRCCFVPHRDGLAVARTLGLGARAQPGPRGAARADSARSPDALAEGRCASSRRKPRDFLSRHDGTQRPIGAGSSSRPAPMGRSRRGADVTLKPSPPNDEALTMPPCSARDICRQQLQHTAAWRRWLASAAQNGADLAGSINRSRAAEKALQATPPAAPISLKSRHFVLAPRKRRARLFAVRCRGRQTLGRGSWRSVVIGSDSTRFEAITLVFVCTERARLEQGA